MSILVLLSIVSIVSVICIGVLIHDVSSLSKNLFSLNKSHNELIQAHNELVIALQGEQDDDNGNVADAVLAQV